MCFAGLLLKHLVNILIEAAQKALADQTYLDAPPEDPAAQKTGTSVSEQPVHKVTGLHEQPTLVITHEIVIRPVMLINYNTLYGLGP